MQEMRHRRIPPPGHDQLIADQQVAPDQCQRERELEIRRQISRDAGLARLAAGGTLCCASIQCAFAGSRSASPRKPRSYRTALVAAGALPCGNADAVPVTNKPTPSQILVVDFMPCLNNVGQAVQSQGMRDNRCGCAISSNQGVVYSYSNRVVR